MVGIWFSVPTTSTGSPHSNHSKKSAPHALPRAPGSPLHSRHSNCSRRDLQTQCTGRGQVEAAMPGARHPQPASLLLHEGGRGRRADEMPRGGGGSFKAIGPNQPTSGGDENAL